MNYIGTEWESQSFRKHKESKCNLWGKNWKKYAGQIRSGENWGFRRCFPKMCCLENSYYYENVCVNLNKKFQVIEIMLLWCLKCHIHEKNLYVFVYMFCNFQILGLWNQFYSLQVTLLHCMPSGRANCQSYRFWKLQF